MGGNAIALGGHFSLLMIPRPSNVSRNQRDDPFVMCNHNLHCRISFTFVSVHLERGLYKSNSCASVL